MDKGHQDDDDNGSGGGGDGLGANECSMLLRIDQNSYIKQRSIVSLDQETGSAIHG